TAALSEVLPAIERAGLWVTDIEILRLHYAETLRAWRDRFLANRAEIAALYDERFCRMWEFYHMRQKRSSYRAACGRTPTCGRSVRRTGRRTLLPHVGVLPLRQRGRTPT